MSGPLSPVPLPQWKSTGVLQLMEMLISLDTGFSLGMGKIFQYLGVLHPFGIRVMRSYDNEPVFLRSEADGLFSELINASVGEDSKSSWLSQNVTYVHVFTFHIIRKSSR